MSRNARLSYQCDLPDSAFSIVNGKELCGHCQTSIVDFTVMSDEEIRSYISNNSRSVCVKIDSDQLQRVKGNAGTFRKNLAIAATATLLALSAESGAQVDSVKTEQIGNYPASDDNDNVGVGSDSAASAKAEVSLSDEPVVKKKRIKKLVYLRAGRREFYIVNRWPFFGSRYIGLRGKF